MERYNKTVNDLKTQRWVKGHLGRFWESTSFNQLDYVRQPITREETNEWVKKGYDYVKSYTGMMYDNRNTMPAWVDSLKGIFPIFKNMTFTFYKMNTLEIMPEHVDHFRTYMKLFDVPYNKCYRILVMLEDWKPGHYLEIDGQGIVNWIAGDYFVWQSDVPHAASNIGVEPRYTLQVTGTMVDEDENWVNLHWYNIPDRETKYESTQWAMARVLDCVDKEHREKPLYIYMYNGQINDLLNVKHSEDTIEKLNRTGVNFYLTEPLCSYLENAPVLFPPKGTKHDMMFYSEFKGNERPTQFRADELDCIEKYVVRNNLENVTVYTCDYDAEKWYPYYNDNFKVLTNDLFVKSLTPRPLSNSKVEPTFTKKFICLNWRYTSHRHLLAAYVSTLSSYVSWYFRCELSIMGKGTWYNIFDWDRRHPEVFFKLLSGVEILNKNAPMNVDLDLDSCVTVMDKYFMRTMPEGTISDYSSGDYHTSKLESIYRDIFVEIVTESRYAQPTANYSEKTHNSMWNKKPFILAAPPYTLKYLREEGFKTFGDFWDESYDEIENHEDRLIAIMKLIDFIDSKPIEELRDMYVQMTDVLEHNYQLLKTTLKPIVTK